MFFPTLCWFYPDFILILSRFLKTHWIKGHGRALCIMQVTTLLCNKKLWYHNLDNHDMCNCCMWMLWEITVLVKKLVFGPFWYRLFLLGSTHYFPSYAKVWRLIVHQIVHLFTYIILYVHKLNMLGKFA